MLHKKIQGLWKTLRMVNKHFFKPLLDDFHSHLTIPTGFFLKYIQGRKEEKKVKLRADTSKITWEVKIEDGLKLTDGWKEFAFAHNLTTGDILIFRQEEDENLSFHVTILGTSCYEIQYDSYLDDKNNHENKVKKKKKKKKSPIRQARSSSSLDPSWLSSLTEKKSLRKKKVKRGTEFSSLESSCFVAYVSPATLHYDKLNFPRRFAREHGLNNRSEKIVLVNQKGKPWTADLKGKSPCGTVYIIRGWRRFCRDNGLQAGNFITFKLIRNDGTLALRILSQSEKEQSPSTLTEKRFVSLTLKEYCITKYLMFLPTSFTRMNGINEETKMKLLDQNGVEWSTKLRSMNKVDRMRLVGGWRDFFKANNVEIGESVMLELIWEGDTSCILKFCSKVKKETI